MKLDLDAKDPGPITRYIAEDAPESVREALLNTGKHEVLSSSYPYRDEMDNDEYEKQMNRLQVELVKMHHWVHKTGERVVILFEGRDAAGKGGTIQRFVENLSPRSARVVALAKPSNVEAGQWYFQRYVAELPTAGELVLFDRSWYNRAVVENVFGFCTEMERELFFRQVREFEQMLIADGIRLFKIWLNVGRAEQVRRFLKRERNPLKQWKLSPVDVKGLTKWDDFSASIEETFLRSHSLLSPWTVVSSDDKRRARIATVRKVLSEIPYDGRNDKHACAPDPLICGGPDLLLPG